MLYYLLLIVTCMLLTYIFNKSKERAYTQGREDGERATKLRYGIKDNETAVK